VSLREGPILSEASPHRSFDELVDEALSEPIEGWDFSFLRGRTEEQPIPWSYQDIARSLVAQARRVLDVDTGGGEIFSSLRPTQGSVAVEPYHSNVAVAARRLDPLGVRVVERTDETLPVGDGLFDLVLNRHGYLHATETRRVLALGGRLLTQQVGARNDVEFNEALGIPPAVDPTLPFTLEKVVADLESAGFVITDGRKAVIVTRYLDIGAMIFQLRAVPWQAPGFDAVRHRQQLRRIHDQIVNTGWFEVRSQRFLVQAQRLK
jgi:SAM-dependent methyltransferase